MFRIYQPPAWHPESILLAIDEPSLNAYGGVPGIRKPLAEALRLIAAASPKTVAVDLILADNTDPATDAHLEEALHATRNLVLACQLMPDANSWEDPVPRFRAEAAALGHVHAEPDERDSVGRSLPLEEVAGRDRRWALSLEAYRLSRGGSQCANHGISGGSRCGRPADPYRTCRRPADADPLGPAVHADSARLHRGAAEGSAARRRVRGQSGVRRCDLKDRGQGLALYPLFHAHTDGCRRNPCQRLRKPLPRVCS